MHTYATNSPANPRFIAYLVIAAVILSVATGFAVRRLDTFFGWSLGGASAMSFFAALYYAFDRFIWKFGWIRHLLLVPDLNGQWEVEGRTVVKGGQEVDWPWAGAVTICQSWSRLVVVLATGQSESKSIAASLYREEGYGYRLIYHYDNAPQLTEKQLARHTGVCNLVFSDDGTTARGTYFTDKDRMTVGSMQLKRKGV